MSVGSGNRFGEPNVSEAGQMVGTQKGDDRVYFGEFEAGAGEVGEGVLMELW